MKYILMHKNIEVALIDFSISGKIEGISVSSYAKDRIPLGGRLNSRRFHQWWEDRAVPSTRRGSSHALRELGIPSTRSMLLNNLALTLTDCYWVRPIGSNLRWENVSLFSNNFTDVFGELTFDTRRKFRNIDGTLFRCVSSQGELQKKWCIALDGRRFMVKGNNGHSYQQSLNEILATEIHRCQGIQFYTPYALTSINIDDGKRGIGCYSYNFCNENTEFISAWELLQSERKSNSESYYGMLLRVCYQLGISRSYAEGFLEYEILTDFLMSNTDRHMNNIGVLRNPDTLQYIGFAPIYDSGNSMFFSEGDIGSVNLLKIKTHSFLSKEVDLLKYVKSRSCVDISLLPSWDYVYSLYMKDLPDMAWRAEYLANIYAKKIYLLDKFQGGVDLWKMRGTGNQ